MSEMEREREWKRKHHVPEGRPKVRRAGWENNCFGPVHIKKGLFSKLDVKSELWNQ